MNTFYIILGVIVCLSCGGVIGWIVWNILKAIYLDIKRYAFPLKDEYITYIIKDHADELRDMIMGKYCKNCEACAKYQKQTNPMLIRVRKCGRFLWYVIDCDTEDFRLGNEYRTNCYKTGNDPLQDEIFNIRKTSGRGIGGKNGIKYAIDKHELYEKGTSIIYESK